MDNVARSRSAYVDPYQSGPKRRNHVRLARVRGNVVSSVKVDGLSSHKLLYVQDVHPEGPWEDDNAQGEIYVAIDLAGAGNNEIVLVTLGSAARIDVGGAAVPTDAAVVGIVDTVQFSGKTTYFKR
jgi:ethanolamine utilization protein EutN